MISCTLRDESCDVHFSVVLDGVWASLVSTKWGEPSATSSDGWETPRRRIKRTMATIAASRGIPRPTPKPAPNATESFLAAGVEEDSGDWSNVGVDAGLLVDEGFEDEFDDVEVDCAPITVTVEGKPCRGLARNMRAHTLGIRTLKLEIVRRILAYGVVAQIGGLGVATVVAIHTSVTIALGDTHATNSGVVAVGRIHTERRAFFSCPSFVGAACSNIIRREFSDVGSDVLCECADVV